MLRILCVETDINDAVHVGGPARVSHKTFDITDAATIEHFKMWLGEPVMKNWLNVYRSIVGTEVR